jgi:hypothetical protein
MVFPQRRPDAQAGLNNCALCSQQGILEQTLDVWLLLRSLTVARRSELVPKPPLVQFMYSAPRLFANDIHRK